MGGGLRLGVGGAVRLGGHRDVGRGLATTASKAGQAAAEAQRNGEPGGRAPREEKRVSRARGWMDGRGGLATRDASASASARPCNVHNETNDAANGNGDDDANGQTGLLGAVIKGAALGGNHLVCKGGRGGTGDGGDKG